MDSIRLWLSFNWLRRWIPARLRKAIAEQLHWLADDLDPDHSMRYAGCGFRYDVNAHQMVVDWHLPMSRNSCPLWYRNDDYDRAWVEYDQRQGAL